jgi:hypothetical protein
MISARGQQANQKPTPAAAHRLPRVGLHIIFGGGDRLAAIAQGVFGQLQGFAGAQQAVVDLLRSSSA